jgi:hypothetical protein
MSLDYKHQMAALCEQMNPQYFATLAFRMDATVPVGYAARCLRHFHAQLDRALLGPRWANAPTAQRTQCLAVPEGRASGRPTHFYGLHYHLLLAPAATLNGPLDEVMLAERIERSWNRCVRLGTSDVQRLRTAMDRRSASSYATKRLWNAEGLGREHFIILPDARKNPGTAKMAPSRAAVNT